MKVVLFYGLLIVVALAPLPLGANREWAWTLLAAAIGVLAVGWSLVALWRPGAVSLVMSPWPMIGFLAVCAWAVVQAAAPVGPDWAHPLWSLSAETLDENIAGRVSLAPDDSLTALLRLLSYGLAFWLAFQFCRQRENARMLLRWLALAGLVLSAYGLAVYWGELTTLLWWFERDYVPAVRGTFVNRNHFATWLGLCLLCAIALMRGRVAPRRNPVYAVPGRNEWRLEAFLVQAWRPLAVLIVMVAALVLTQSRGGFFSTLAGGLTLLLAMHHRQRFDDHRTRWLLVAVVAAATAAFVITSSILLERLGHLGADSGTRLQAYQLTTDGIEDSPLLGFGYGSFADAFRLYRDESISGFLDKTHNTYLENIFELGWPAALVLFASLAGLALICLRGVRERGRDWVYPATGLAATVLVGVHSLFDFSLQMPATAAAYAVLMGAACAQSRPGRVHPTQPKQNLEN